MGFLNEAKKAFNEDSPFFRADVLKEYKFKMISTRKLTAKDNLYMKDAPKWEFALLDLDTNREKIWTTGGQAVRDMITQSIDEGDSFTVVKTGEVGKGKKYWLIKKIGEGQTKLMAEELEAAPVEEIDVKDIPF